MRPIAIGILTLKTEYQSLVVEQPGGIDHCTTDAPSYRCGRGAFGVVASRPESGCRF